MQQRQLRLGDILDDYCPRERRVTNHAIVAMVGPDVKQTRCTTCDAEHEYKKARVPVPRRKKEAPPGFASQGPVGVTQAPVPTEGSGAETELMAARGGRLLPSESVAPAPPVEPPAVEPAVERPAEEEGPVHRPLIRATLPRTESTVVVRQIPEFTIRQAGGRSGNFRAGSPHRHRTSGGAAGPGDGGPRHIGRSGLAGGRGSGFRQQQPSHHPQGTRSARPGKKHSR